MSATAVTERLNPQSNYPESRVLIIMTGGTICMQPSSDGLVPMAGFLENAMAPRPSFNDASDPGIGAFFCLKRRNCLPFGQGALPDAKGFIG